MSVKVLDEIDITPFITAYQQLESGIIWNEYPNGRQTGLQYTLGNDPWSDAVGRSKPGYNWHKDVQLNQYFKGSVFEDFINRYNLTRTRFMWSRPCTCYSMHRDDSPRIHLPLVTNPDCYFVFKDEGLFHFEVGKVYWVDTTKPHTFINCSKDWRLHLLGAL